MTNPCPCEVCVGTELAEPQDLSNPDHVRHMTNRSYVKWLDNALNAGRDDMKAKIIAKLKAELALAPNPTSELAKGYALAIHDIEHDGWHDANVE